MAGIEHIPAEPSDALWLVGLLREEDLAEVEASHGPDVVEALALMIRRSFGPAKIVYSDGIPLGVWGVWAMSVIGGWGIPWVVTTDEVDRRPKVFYRECKKIVRELAQEWPMLTNCIDARYGRAVRWAQRLGFSIGDPVPVGRRGEPFIPVKLGG